MFYIYILLCADNSYYVGHTDDLEKRLTEHNAKKYDGYTAKRLPIKLVYSESFSTRDEAFIVEQKIKGWSRAKKQALIEGDWNKIVFLSNNNARTLRQAQGERSRSERAFSTEAPKYQGERSEQ